MTESVKSLDLSNIEFEFKYALAPNSADLFLEGLAFAINVYHHNLRALDPKLKEQSDLLKLNFDSLQEQKLTNIYFDTDQDDLFSKFSAGLRLRKSSLFTGCEQTLKMRGDSDGLSHDHLEFNVRTQEQLELPNLDLFAQSKIDQSVLAKLKELDIKAKYATDFVRKTTEVYIAHAGLFEIALDSGLVKALDYQTDISEVEFELKKLDLEFFDDPYKEKYDLNAVKTALTHTLNSIISIVNLYLITHYEGTQLNQERQALDLTKLNNLFATDQNINQAKEVINTNHKQCLAFDQVLNTDYLDKTSYAVVSLEPFSKLHRAISLYKLQQQKQQNQVQLPRIDLAKIHEYFAKAQDVLIYDFINFKDDISLLTKELTKAIGFTRLFKTKDHLSDLVECLKSIDVLYNKLSQQLDLPLSVDPLVNQISDQNCHCLSNLYSFANLKTCLHVPVLAAKLLIKDLNFALSYLNAHQDSLTTEQVEQLIMRSLYRAGAGRSFFIILEAASILNYFLCLYCSLSCDFVVDEVLSANEVAHDYLRENKDNASLWGSNWFYKYI